MNDSGYNLPYDILGLIIDQIALEERDARITLDALSQTCKLMVPMCRRHLFSSIQLSRYNFTYISHCEKIAFLLENVEIASYVRRLSYSVKELPDDFANAILEFLLRHSICLHSIHLVANTDRHNIWNAQPDIIKSLLISLIQQPTITHLRFANFQGFFPYNRLSLCTGLRSLELCHLGNLSAVDIDPITTPVSHQAPAPSSLEVFDSFAVLNILMDPTKGSNALGPIINFSHLQKVDLYIRSSTELAQIGELLETAEQLEELYMRGK